MAKDAATIVMVDNDTSFCRSTERMIRSSGLPARVQEFHTPEEFLRSRRPSVPACVVLEARLPGLNGLEVQRELARAGITIPLIFVTAHGDISMAVQAVQAGAVDFLTKPVRQQKLLDDIQQAFRRDQANCEHQNRLAYLREHYELLTPCERKVMEHVVVGRLNKQTAAELGVTEKTVKFHRGHIMRKMKAQSAVELLRMAQQLCVLPASILGSRWL